MEWKGSFRVSIVLSTISMLVFLAFYAVMATLEEPEGDLPIVEFLGIAIDSEDDIHIVWEDGRDEEIFVSDRGFLRTKLYYSKFDSKGKRLVDDAPITTGGGRTPSIEVDSEDSIWVSYSINGSFLMKLDAMGRKIFEKKILDHEVTLVMTTIGSDDNIYLYWNECWQLQCFKYYTSVDNNGNILVPSTNVTTVTQVTGFPIVADTIGEYVYLGDNGASDSEHNLHVIQRPDRGVMTYTKISGDGEIIVNNSRLGVSYSAPMVGIDTFDKIHVIGGNSYGMGYIKLNETGVVMATGGLSDEIGDTWQYFDLDTDSSGNVYVVWNVVKTTLPYPHSGLEDLSYSSYCSDFSRTWVVAKSKAPGPGIVDMLGNAGIFLFASLLVINIVVYSIGRRKSRKNQI